MSGRIVGIILGPMQVMALSKLPKKAHRNQIARILAPIDAEMNDLTWREAGERRWIKVTPKEQSDV